MVDVNRFLHGIKNVPKENKIAALERASSAASAFRIAKEFGWGEPAAVARELLFGRRERLVAGSE